MIQCIQQPPDEIRIHASVGKDATRGSVLVKEGGLAIAMDSRDANIICGIQMLGGPIFGFIFSYFLTISRGTTTLIKAKHKTE